jgi:cytochrome c oxidase subunit 2
MFTVDWSLFMTPTRLLQCRTTVAAFISLAALGSAGFAAQAPGRRTIDVIARRYAFEPAQIEVAVGEPVRLMVRSADGVHGLEIKKLKVKKTVPRGSEAVAIDFTATEAGQFPILCSEYCGDEHDSMKGMLVVTTAATTPTP